MNCTFPDSISDLPCRILPAVSKFNATDQEINFGQNALWNSIGTNDFYFAVKFRCPDKTNSMGIAGTSMVGNYDKFVFANSASKLKMHIYFLSSATDRSALVDYNVNETYTAIINCDRSGNATYYLNGLLVSQNDISAAAADDFAPVNDMRVGSYGLANNTNGSLWFNGNVYWVKFGIGLLSVDDIENIESFESDWATYPVGNPAYEYDIFGSKNGQWNGNAAGRFEYLTDGESFHNEKGISLWESGANKEYIPYYDNSARAAGQAPGGYVKTFDSAYVAGQWNLAKATINFDPNNTGNSKLDVFDKSNSTFHIATGSMDYYNSGLVYEWTIEELITYASYNAYFNEAYQDRLFTKISNNHLAEILNCSSKQTGNNLNLIKSYCGI